MNDPDWLTEEIIDLCRFLGWAMVIVFLTLVGSGLYYLLK